MKNVIGFIILILVLFGAVMFASADVYVLLDSDTKEVKSVSDEDDAVLEVGWEKKVLPGKRSDYPLFYKSKYYKMTGKKFVVNTKKISDEENVKNKKKDNQNDLAVIKARIYKDTCEKMVSEGYEFKEIKCSDF